LRSVVTRYRGTLKRLAEHDRGQDNS
jgi:hypothetical protein